MSIVLLVSTPAFAQGGSELTGMVSRYLQGWNNHDAALLTRDFLDLPDAHPWSTEAGMAAMFEGLREDGYSHSTVQGLSGCATGPDTGHVELIYTRLDTEGEVIEPARRMTIYDLRRTGTGWRITAINPVSGGADGARMTCERAS